jgi:hypothetical protein
MSDSRVAHRVSHFRLESLDDELLLYHPGLTRTIRLNQSAALVWTLCDGRRAVDEICELLRGAFAGESASIPADVALVVDTLVAQGALELH